MKNVRSSWKTLPLLALAAISLLAPAAGSAADVRSALSLVPRDAVSIGSMRIAELRTSPMFARMFSDADSITLDGDAARFLRDTGLNPKRDVDVVVFAALPTASGSRSGSGLIAFEGRFDVAKLSSALTSRGAVKATSGGQTYFRIQPPKGAKGASQDEKGAVAFLSSRLGVAGDEAAVMRALGEHSRGQSVLTGPLGRQLGRIEPGATAWLIVDPKRAEQLKGDMKSHSGASEKTAAVASILKGVSMVTLWMSEKGDALRFGGTASSPDEETLGLVEDTLRGLLAAWRMAAQEKSPELVSAIRQLKIDNNDGEVTFRGSLPAGLIQKLAKKPATTR